MAGRETSEKHVFGITLAIVAVVLAAVSVFTFLSYRELGSLKTDTTSKVRLAGEHQKVVDTRQNVENQLNEAEARFANVKKYLPEDKDVDGLLDAFGKKCIDSKLDFSRLERSGTAGAGAARKPGTARDVENIQFKGEFSGTFHSLARFVSMLENWQHFERFVNITQFKMEAGENGQGYDTGAQKHSISMTLELYKYEEPKVTATAAKPAAGRKPGGAK